MRPKRRHPTPEDPDIVLRLHMGIMTVIRKFTRAIQTQVITAWMPEIERRYNSRYKQLADHQTDAKQIMGIVFRRIETHDFTKPLTITLQYTPTEKFTILSTYTAEEIEHEEFLKWKNKKK